jgi:hypothetical protein
MKLDKSVFAKGVLMLSEPGCKCFTFISLSTLVYLMMHHVESLVDMGSLVTWTDVRSKYEVTFHPGKCTLISCNEDREVWRCRFAVDTLVKEQSWPISLRRGYFDFTVKDGMPI